MRKYLFFVTIVTFIFLQNIPLSVNAAECQFPDLDYAYFSNYSEITNEFFPQKDFYILFTNYKMNDPEYRDNYSEFHFKNLVRLAKARWGKQKTMKVSDFWDAEGRAKPYILIELGGKMVSGDLHTNQGKLRIGTCYDINANNKANLANIANGDYATLIENVEKVFIPVLVFENGMEKRQ